jgi:4-hydroxy-tetrahydrodipicolinate synthase
MRSADLHQALHSKKCTFTFYIDSGDDSTALSIIASGGKGVISVYANAYPSPFSTMIRNALSGEWARRAIFITGYWNLHQWLYIEGNPVGIKEAIAYKGWAGSELRLPLVQMSDSNKKKVAWSDGCGEGFELSS